MINLVVLYCQDIHQSKSFYECFGMSFVEEKHGQGPTHFSAELDGIIFELYPKGEKEITRTRLGLNVSSLDAFTKKLRDRFPNTPIKTIEFDQIKKRLVTDPNGIKIEVME